ncbi:glutathione S-transferase family protein [Salinicola acroporae]|uniref:Glutathione S-transferase n=1 Tax=Salinicola acroporae TaxID=1541440 RepID=A0ABT6I6X4_9GAMM|nr:glutathione S-transferase [Salinicola acroporae]MDH4573421.1 glutathione S-transferase [Salinicola acroporae]
MITVHHLENSRSQRILWLLEELGVEYEVRTYRRDPKTMLAPAELKRIHPLGKSPIITDDAYTVAESGAIIEYLVSRYDGDALVPEADTPERLRYTYWLHYAEGSAMPLLVMKLVFSKLGKPPVPAVIRPIGRLLANGVRQKFLDPQLEMHLDYWESELRQHPWFAGDEFSAADIQMSFPLLAAESRADLSERPNIKKVLKNMRERPAYQRAVERGGEFRL